MTMLRARSTVIIPRPNGEPEVTIYQGNSYNDSDATIAAVYKEHPWAFETEAEAAKK